VGRVEDRGVAALHPVATHGFAAVVLLVEGSEAHDVALEVCEGVPSILARTIYKDTGATLDDLREAVTTLAEIEPSARRVLGGAHPTTAGIEDNLRYSRAALCARETPSRSA
jgi:hypothetical protein